MYNGETPYQVWDVKMAIHTVAPCCPGAPGIPASPATPYNRIRS